MSEDKTNSPGEKKKKKNKLKKRVLRKLALTLTPPIAYYWMHVYDHAVRARDHALLTLLDYEELSSIVREHKQPIIAALWHNRLMYGPTAYRYLNGHGAVIMVSRSFDGDLIAATLGRFKNMHAVRGSSSNKPGHDKGGREALQTMIEAAKEGYDLVITPDGPLGPRYRVKRGIIDLAAATGFPIYTVGCATRRYIEINSWDRTRLPIPSRTVYRGSPPIHVPKDADEETIEAKRRELEKMMNELTDFADHYFDEEKK